MLILAWIYGTHLLFTNTGACPGVIGVVYNQQGIVRDVFDRSPADAAGITIDDKILNQKSTRGEEGTEATVTYIRPGEDKKTVTVTRVCVDDLESRSW